MATRARYFVDTLALVLVTWVSVLVVSVMMTVIVDVRAAGVLDIGGVSGSEKL